MSAVTVFSLSRLLSKVEPARITCPGPWFLPLSARGSAESSLDARKMERMGSGGNLQMLVQLGPGFWVATASTKHSRPRSFSRLDIFCAA